MTDPTKPCCAPTAERAGQLSDLTFDQSAKMDRSLRDCVRVPGGQALVGTAHPILVMDGEGPLRRKKVKPMLWERGAVTVQSFERFVQSTGYQSEAERFGWSFVFHSHVPEAAPSADPVPGLDWWRKVDGANWAHPTGPYGPAAQADHPVTQISWNDATAYAAWAGGRLPKEAEWEHAARGGLGDVPFPWGAEEPNDIDSFPCNIWQGRFPDHDTGADGYSGTAPAQSFEPNGYGLFQMVGNVWEWTADAFRVNSLKKTARAHGAATKGYKLMKGGSFLCHVSYCYRYRIAARTGNSPDSATGHMGFRVVYDVD